MGYKLGKGSLSKLEGIDDRIATVVKYAIGVTKQDFSVICGLRTIEEQRALVAKGASQTMNSNSYIDLRRSQGRRPFIDAPHFELVL